MFSYISERIFKKFTDKNESLVIKNKLSNPLADVTFGYFD